jgi:hypothetical protein
LKWLSLPSSVSDARPYKLGYNFFDGEVNRDRQRLADKLEEANVVRRIWESAIQKVESTMLPVYVNLLRNFLHAPDIELADQLLDSHTRRLIWKRLLEEANGKQFYYNEKSGPQVCMKWIG